MTDPLQNHVHADGDQQGDDDRQYAMGWQAQDVCTLRRVGLDRSVSDLNERAHTVSRRP